jgi:hypothetical protein
MKLTKLAAFAVLASLATGCAHANFASSPGAYSVEGYSRNPEAMAATLSSNYVAETNAHTYRDCVMSGRCYAYMGGGYGNDFAFYYGHVAPPAMMPGPAPTSTVSGPQGNAVDECARAMAADSLRAQAGEPLKGLPKGCEYATK